MSQIQLESLSQAEYDQLVLDNELTENTIYVLKWTLTPLAIVGDMNEGSTPWVPDVADESTGWIPWPTSEFCYWARWYLRFGRAYAPSMTYGLWSQDHSQNLTSWGQPLLDCRSYIRRAPRDISLKELNFSFNAQDTTSTLEVDIMIYKMQLTNDSNAETGELIDTINFTGGTVANSHYELTHTFTDKTIAKWEYLTFYLVQRAPNDTRTRYLRGMNFILSYN